jgi:ABC-2 type transport system permease protein
MQAFLAILQYDFLQLTRSWISRIWLPLLIAPAIFLVIVAESRAELASETMAFYVTTTLAPISALAVAILASGAISGESSIISDSILSRSVTRTEYVAAKIISRIGFTLIVYTIVVIPFTYLMFRFAVQDASLSGVALGWLVLASLLTFLAALGIAMSVAMSNVLPAVLAVLLTVILSGAVLQFLGLSWMSSTAVIDQLPQTFRGETDVWEQLRVLSVFSGLSLLSLIAGTFVFRHKDL